jgi:energy-coupling factor transporter ATP-binding protein EcfA2
MKKFIVKQEFPRDLLKASLEQRLAYFAGCMVNHSMLKGVREDAMYAFSHSAGARVVLVTGPSGVGKSTLCENIARSLREHYVTQMAKEKDFVPVMIGNAVSPSAISFSWKDFYIRLLQRFDEPLISHKLFTPRQGELFPAHLLPKSPDRMPVDSLRRAVEECLRRRKTKYLLIDEAHHILMVKNAQHLEFQFEHIKSLTIETGVTIGLVGTYRLLDIRDQSGQLVRRSTIVPFQRYDMATGTHMNDFASALAYFQSRLPLKEMPDLVSNVDYFYDRSGGCIGILKDWLLSALEYSIVKGVKFMPNAANAKGLTYKELRTIITEALLGEEKLKDIDPSEIRRLLQHGLPRIEPQPKKESGRKVGERSPVRDSAGGVYKKAA